MPAVAPARNHGCVAVRLTGGVVTGRGLRGWAPGARPLGAVSPVGARAGPGPGGPAPTAAVEEGRWSALRLASAASDVLGPEQLVRVLALTAADGAEPVPRGATSALADQLARVLGPLPGPRRLSLLVDLWDTVCAHHDRERRRERLRATQGPADRTEGLRRRYAQWDDELLLDSVHAHLGRNPSIPAAARWTPPWWYWQNQVNRLMLDAIAATALIRVALAVADLGVVEGVARCAGALHASAQRLD